MCDQLDVSRSGYYAWRSRDASAHETQDALLTRLIHQFFERLRGNPACGACTPSSRRRPPRRPQARLAPHAGAGLQDATPSVEKTTTPGDRPVPAPDLIKRPYRREAEREVVRDITYIKTWDGWAYVATVIDLHSRA